MTTFLPAARRDAVCSYTNLVFLLFFVIQIFSLTISYGTDTPKIDEKKRKAYEEQKYKLVKNNVLSSKVKIS